MMQSTTEGQNYLQSFISKYLPEMRISKQAFPNSPAPIKHSSKFTMLISVEYKTSHQNPPGKTLIGM